MENLPSLQMLLATRNPIFQLVCYDAQSTCCRLSWEVFSVFLPLIDMNPSDLTCIYSTLHFVCKEAHSNDISPKLTFCHPLHCKKYKKEICVFFSYIEYMWILDHGQGYLKTVINVNSSQIQSCTRGFRGFF